jgi:outer membrane PBP1 activator LpoA protein
MKKYLLLSFVLLMVGCGTKITPTSLTSPFSTQPTSEQPEQTFSNAGPTHVALLLPLNGKLDAAAQAFRDGFFNAFYADKKAHHTKVVVTVIDTKNDANVVASYQKAIDKGADFIIGPLTKNGVTALSNSNAVSVPTLALNKVPQKNNAPEKLFFFSLAPEDEAVQVVKQARHHGASSAMIIAEKSDWGERTATAFAKHWQQLGGTVAGTAYYREDEKFDDFAKKAFQINVTEKDQDGKVLAFTQRKDLDMVFLASNAEDARQIRPFVSLYYTDKLPVFATASIFTESPNATLARETNGIIFCDMPWVIDSRRVSNSLRSGLDEMWTNSSVELSRLYAMGADAYALSKQIDKTNSYAKFSYHGATGYLTVGSDRAVKRELLCARLQGGKPRILR